MGEGNRTTRPGEITQLIQQLCDDTGAAAERLLPLVYQELRALAQSFFEGQRPDHTLQPTALVHEAFIRLVGNTEIQWESRSHFLAVAAKAMRNVLSDHARGRRAAKRGGDWQRVTLSGIGSDAGARAYDACDIDEVLKELADLNERHARIVELRFFAGLTVNEAAAVLGVSERTIRGEWRLARAWLRQRLGTGEPA
jgi:RNA polymerase sigma-70 factor, ECF subfamily